ncbi:MAG: hypothetical protein P8Z35_17845 [Ignavibacteriaceae bacterium]
MILFWLIAILFVGGLIAWLSEKVNTILARVVSLIALLIDFVMIVIFWFANYDAIKLSSNNDWITQINWSWIPEFGIRFHLAIDGLSLILIALTLFLGILSVLTSWSEIRSVSFILIFYGYLPE